MNSMFTKITADAFKSFEKDAGVILNTFDPTAVAAPDDEDIICATTGGITISAVPTFVDDGEDVDNCPENTKELKHISGWECKISFTALDITAETLKLALGAADVTTDTSKKVSTVKPRADVSTSDFQDIWWVGDTAQGCVAAKLINALSTAGLSITTSKDGKGNLAVELTGHLSINSTSTIPMEFYAITTTA